MKAKLTKVLSLVLVVIMALSLMTGCSTSSSGKGTKTQDDKKSILCRSLSPGCHHSISHIDTGNITLEY